MCWPIVMSQILHFGKAFISPNFNDCDVYLRKTFSCLILMKIKLLGTRLYEISETFYRLKTIFYISTVIFHANFWYNDNDCFHNHTQENDSNLFRSRSRISFNNLNYLIYNMSRWLRFIFFMMANILYIWTYHIRVVDLVIKVQLRPEK